MAHTPNPFQLSEGRVREELFVGRTELLRDFRDALARPGAGESSVWVVSGDRGQGKSSLAHYIHAAPQKALGAVRPAIVNFEWTTQKARTGRPLARHLFASVGALAWWEHGLERARRAYESVAGQAAGPVPLPQIPFRPHDGRQFAESMRSRLVQKCDSMVVFIDEVGVCDEAAERSLNFARECGSTTGLSNQLNLVVVLLIVRRYVREYLARRDAPRTPREYTLDDFNVADVTDLVTRACDGAGRTFAADIPQRVWELSGGRPDISMALLHDAWTLMENGEELNCGHLEAARNGKDTVPRVNKALEDVGPLAVGDTGRVLAGLSELEDAFARGSHRPEEWWTAIRARVSANLAMRRAFDTVWRNLAENHITLELEAQPGMWRFRGELLRCRLRDLVRD